MTLEQQIFKITRRASLNYNDSNPGFIFFRNMNPSAARSSAKKLCDSGFQAKVSPIDKQMIIIEMQKSVFGKTM